MEIKLVPKAEKDLREISTYLTQYFPKKSASTYHALEQACINLVELPEMGKMGKVKDTKEVKIGSLPYRIIYKISGNTLFVLRIYHTSRKPLN